MAVDAFERYVEERPDVVVVDINLPIVSGLALTRRLLKYDANARIIIFSMNDDVIFASRAIESGAKGYIGKSEDPARFIAAIRAVAMGQTFLVPEMATQLARWKVGAYDCQSGHASTAYSKLPRNAP